MVDYVVFLVERGDVFSKFPQPTGPSLCDVCCVKTLHLYKIKIITFSTKVITFPVGGNILETQLEMSGQVS